MSAAWTVIGDGLKIVAGLLDHGSPTALAAAGDLVKTLVQAHEGTLTSDDVTAKLQALRDHLAANDAAALALLHGRFVKVAP